LGSSEAQTEEILDAWLATAYQPNRADDACLDGVRRLRGGLSKGGKLAGDEVES
jgi:hypothetical protein